MKFHSKSYRSEAKNISVKKGIASELYCIKLGNDEKKKNTSLIQDDSEEIILLDFLWIENKKREGLQVRLNKKGVQSMKRFSYSF